MTKAVIDPECCQPEFCEGGVCAIRRVCPTRAIWQEEPFEVPVADPQRCRSCSKCMLGCPLKAVRMV